MKTVLVITDGIGLNADSSFNAFFHAKKPNYDRLFATCPNSLLKTSGFAVGLPDGQMGNSEVGHMTIGSGRVLYQNLVKIDRAIEENSLRENLALRNLLDSCTNIHIIGLYSDGGVHSHLNHINAVAKIAQDNGNSVFIHAITDGRDVSPTSGLNFIKTLENSQKIATISGRFYAMDRDKRWERVQKAYESIANGTNLQTCAPSEYVKKSYDEGVTDEFISPAAFGDFKGIGADDGIIFMNFRNDRAREICMALSSANFAEFERKFNISNLITLTNYDATFKFPVMFDNEEIKNTLCEVISRANLTQLHTAETEKYAHVTFFFNGGKEEPNLNETRILVPSPKVATYDEKPEMSAFEVCDCVLKGMENGEDFIVVNFANGDMVGHTGNFEAAVKAVEAVDSCIGKITQKAQELGYAYMQISDHGNCEAMKDAEGNALTNHTTFDVFCFVLADGVEKIKNGGLNNVAPTVLKLMNLEIPSEMDEALF